VVPYRCVDVEGKLILGWDTTSLAHHTQGSSDRVAERAMGQAVDDVRVSAPETLTPEEWAFFQPLKNR
jgi:hypothetical protein